MPTYGHAVSFGVLIDAGPTPQGAVDLAVRADRAGLDLALFADGADEVDAAGDPWALATWAAGRTERITLGVAGLSVAGRPPSVLARAAGSLSLLSGDRVAVSLATTADPEALADAIAVVRAVLDTSVDQATHRGRQHTITGAQPGPVLDREVPFWLSGSDPDAADLAGTAADGLLMNLDEAGGADGLAHLNTVIDAAAAPRGRDPREIRRLVTLTPPGQGSPSRPQVRAWIEDLVRLAVDHGVSGLLLRAPASPYGSADAVDDAADALLRVFAEQVAPAAREAIADSQPGLGAQRIRRAAVRAKRHPGIDYDAVPASLTHTAVEPGDPAYGRVKSTYMRGGAPGLVLRPDTVEQVADAVGYARQNPHLDLGIRSGGHGLSGRSTNHGGLVIDVGRLNQVQVLDEQTRLVRLGPGARWRDVAGALQPHGWAIGSGDYGGVGVGGLVTAGGVGFLSRHHGLTIDNVRAAELVLADGSALRVSTDEHPEVFWAVRGAGANLGIVTAVEITASPVTEVGWAQLGFHVPDVARFLTEFGAVATSAPRQTTAFLIMGPSRGGSATAQVMAMVDSNDPDVIIDQLQPFAQIPTLIQQQVVIAPYAAVMTMFPDQPHQGRGEPVSRSGLLREVTADFARDAAALLDSGAIHWFQLRTMGGAIGDVHPEATAFVHRDAQMHVTAMGANAQRVDRWWNAVRPHFHGLYLSFETDRSPERLVEAFGEKGLARLRRLKRELDPHSLFRDNFAVSPQGSGENAAGPRGSADVAPTLQGGPRA